MIISLRPIMERDISCLVCCKNRESLGFRPVWKHGVSTVKSIIRNGDCRLPVLLLTDMPRD